PAGELDERRAERESARPHFLAPEARPAVERLRRVAPRAAQVAPRQTHEPARQPGERRLALDARVNLVHDERVFFHAAFGGLPRLESAATAPGRAMFDGSQRLP